MHTQIPARMYNGTPSTEDLNMASNTNRYGNFEYGDVYDYDKETQSRSGKCLGKLIVDSDKERFYIKPPGKASKSIPHDRVNWMLANDLIDFYHEDSREFLIDFMMRLEHNRESVKQQQRANYANQKATAQLEANNKLVKKTRRRARLSRFVWVLGCFALVTLGVIAAIPTPEPAPAEESIAGVGMQYPVDSELLSDATYMQAFGNGADLYGIVVDNTIIESGQANSNESPIKENVLINAAVSQKYPIHMRPLYYDRSAFYQSQLILNDAEKGSSGIVLQNPNGYSLGKAANELVLFGGRGMGSIVLSAPESYQAESASETARKIEQAQEEAARIAQGKGGNSSEREEYLAGEMPAGWNGYDYADIDSKVVAASYWYTRDSSLKKEDLHRRVVIWNIDSVYNQGEDGVDGLEPIQMNYQDKDSDFYNPVVSMSPSSNGSEYWIGYAKKTSDGSTGFFVRHYENAEDILLESYDNTFSTKDLTGNEFPITNYTLHGDRLFFEQQGYIWVMDLSKASIEVEGDKRTIKKENPIRICKSNEIRPSVTRDEQFVASVNNATTVPVSHYQVVTMTTAGGQVVYGIAFVEADTGNIVFQPVNGATVAAAEANKGAGGDTTSLDVGSSDQAALDRAQAEEEARNQQARGNQQSNENQSQQQQPSQSQPEQQDVVSVPSGDTIVPDATAGANPPVVQSAYTLAQASAEDEDIDTGRILIKAGTPDVQIVCFCVRGEQFYWMEQDSATKERRIMCSPIYYKNDASKIASDAMEEVDENGEVAREGIQPDEQGQATHSTSADVALDNGASAQQQQQQQQQLDAVQQPDQNAIAQQQQPTDASQQNPPPQEQQQAVPAQDTIQQ